MIPVSIRFQAGERERHTCHGRKYPAGVRGCGGCSQEGHGRLRWREAFVGRRVVRLATDIKALEGESRKRLERRAQKCVRFCAFPPRQNKEIERADNSEGTSAALEADPGLARRYEILLSNPGIGSKNRHHPDRRLERARLSERKADRHAGRDRSGGQRFRAHQGARIIRGVWAIARKMLHLAAVSAARCDAALRAFYLRLAEKSPSSSLSWPRPESWFCSQTPLSPKNEYGCLSLQIRLDIKHRCFPRNHREEPHPPNEKARIAPGL
jgi:hypothetical protein